MTTTLFICDYRIYVDVVMNHMTGNHQDARGVCGCIANTGQFNYPAVPYTKEDFNLPNCGIQNYDNFTEVMSQSYFICVCFLVC